MKRFVLVVTLLLTFLLFLTACQVTITPIITPDETVSATLDPQQAVSTFNLPVGASRVVEVLLPTEVQQRQAIYLELDKNLDLVVYRSNANVYASSSSAQFFATGELGVQTDLEVAEIGVTVTCRGSCVIRDANESSFLVKVTNESSSGLQVKLFAYAEDYQDQGEFANDTLAGAVPLGASQSGAIESLGDIDFYAVTINGSLSLNSVSSVGIRGEIYDAFGNFIDDLVPGGPGVRTVAGDYVQIFAQNNERAAASASSLYNLSIE